MVFFPSLRADNSAIALIENGQPTSYATLHRQIEAVACGLLSQAADLHEERIATFMPACTAYVSSLLGIWSAGGLAVPLNISASLPELEYCLGHAGVSRLITLPGHAASLAPLCAQLNITMVLHQDVITSPVVSLPSVAPQRRAMMLYTSGTTSKPKGVVTTRQNISTQITTLLGSWGWQNNDVIPLFLPLHHIHGIINVLCCALWQGATVHLYPRFEMNTILDAVAKHTYTLFMAVPTIYVKILQALDDMEEAQRTLICQGFADLRLTVSGSAACPVKLFEQWQTMTGQIFLERYGMTEIGMALSNPYTGERRAGYVGLPLPGVSVQLFDEAHQLITTEDTPGEIRIQGNNVFLEYWQNPVATRESFHEGWFCTGDVAVMENGYFRIMGRMSVDIIKSGGYKLSALEIEGTLLTHEAIAECAVIGVTDDTWGEAVCAFIVLKPGSQLDADTLKQWCKQKMSPYKVPKHLLFPDSLPRNAMGKVTKPALRTLLAR